MYWKSGNVRVEFNVVNFTFKKKKIQNLQNLILAEVPTGIT